MLKADKWNALVEKWLDHALTVEPPPDSDPRTAILDELPVFLERNQTQERAQVWAGRVFWDDEKGEAVFRLNDFMKHLRAQRLQFPQSEVTRYLRDNGIMYSEKGTTWSGKSGHIWRANIADVCGFDE
jgi:hypothetical protein